MGQDDNEISDTPQPASPKTVFGWIRELEIVQLIQAVGAAVAILAAAIGATAYLTHLVDDWRCNAANAQNVEKSSEKTNQISDLTLSKNGCLAELAECKRSRCPDVGPFCHRSPHTASSGGANDPASASGPYVKGALLHLPQDVRFDLGRALPTAIGVTIQLIGFNRSLERTRATLLITDVDGPTPLPTMTLPLPF